MAVDHFSSVAAKYAECRPSYPPALVEYLAGIAPGHALAWDCGTGSGQAAVLLAERFDRVVATDQSEAQLRHATRHPGIEYHHRPERVSGLDDACGDLVAVAQAAHWFDLPAFYAEVDRVLKPRGVLAIWGYALLLVAPEIDAVIDEFTHVRVGAYWPPGRELAEDRYRSLPFPYARIEAPAFVMEQRWTAADCLSFIGTWSAVDRCRAAERRDPVAEIAPTIERLWGSGARLAQWPIHLLVGRKNGAMGQWGNEWVSRARRSAGRHWPPLLLARLGARTARVRHRGGSRRLDSRAERHPSLGRSLR